MGPAGGPHQRVETLVDSEWSGSPRKNRMGEHQPFQKFKILGYMPLYAEEGTHPHDVGRTIFGPSGAGKGVPFLKVHTGHLSCPEEGQTDPRQKLTGVPSGAAS